MRRTPESERSLVVRAETIPGSRRVGPASAELEQHGLGKPRWPLHIDARGHEPGRTHALIPGISSLDRNAKRVRRVLPQRLDVVRKPRRFGGSEPGADHYVRLVGLVEVSQPLLEK